MSILFSSLFASGGGGGFFVPTFASGTLTVFSVSGTVITLTPPLGERVRLNALSRTAAVETGMTMKVGGVTVVSSLDLADGAGSPGRFNVAQGASAAAASGSAGTIPLVIGGVDEIIEVIKDSGTLSGTVFYAYETGVLK